MLRRALTLIAAVPTLVAAQGSTKTAAPASSSPPPPRPEIYIRSPSNNSTIGGQFLVIFGLRNYGVAPAGVNTPRTGHFHLLINGEPPAAGVVIPNDSTHLHYGGGQIETMLNLKPGTYTIRAVLGDFEHKVINSDLVSAPIKITVTAPSGGRQ